MAGYEKYFTTLAIQCMKENEIDLKKLGSRLQNLNDLDEVFSFKNRGRKSVYPEWAFRKAKENGISRQLLHNRIRIQGLSIEEAVTREVRK